IHARRHAACDRRSFDRPQLAIADHATREGLEVALDREGTDDLLELPLGIGGANPVSAGDDAALEQTHVAGQQDAALARGKGCEPDVAAMTLVERIEAEEPQSPREGAE